MRNENEAYYNDLADEILESYSHNPQLNYGTKLSHKNDRDFLTLRKKKLRNWHSLTCIIPSSFVSLGDIAAIGKYLICISSSRYADPKRHCFEEVRREVSALCDALLLIQIHNTGCILCPKKGYFKFSGLFKFKLAR